MVFVLPGCGQESPALASPASQPSRDTRGTAIAGATQVVFTATVSRCEWRRPHVSWDLGDGRRRRSVGGHVYATEGVFPVP
jgi:hypothetical protein